MILDGMQLVTTTMRYIHQTLINEYVKRLTADGIRQTIETIGKRAGLEGVRCSPHTFRHTFATESLRNGAGEFNVP